jgi:hypothetical protein
LVLLQESKPEERQVWGHWKVLDCSWLKVLAEESLTSLVARLTMWQEGRRMKLAVQRMTLRLRQMLKRRRCLRRLASCPGGCTD